MSLAAAFSCQGKPDGPDPTLPQLIEAREGTSTIASVRAGRPCRATIGPNEMIVGGPPLVSQLGETRWGGEVTNTGELISRDGQVVARLFPMGDAAAAGIYDPTGVAMERIALEAGKVTVSDASSRVVHTAKTTGPRTIAIDDGKVIVSGTDDLVLAALIGTPEVLPELRMLAACERVLLQRQKAGT